MKMKRNKRSLFLTVGLFLLVSFALTIILNTRAVSGIYSARQLEKMQAQAKKETDYVRDELCDYEALPWLLTYWEENYDKMDIPRGALSDALWVELHQPFFGADNKSFSVERAEHLSAEGKKRFAEVCYMELAGLFDDVLQDFSMIALTCTMYQGNEESFTYFAGYPADSEATLNALGVVFPFHAELHPVAAEIYESGKDISEIERATSTSDGNEYLFIYSPVLVDGELRCLITETLLWSDVKAEIDAGARDVALVTALLFFVLFVTLMAVLYWRVIIPFSNVQRNVRAYQKKEHRESAREGLLKAARSKNEIGLLSSDVSDMIDALERYVEEVRVQTAEKERIGTELSLAAKIQADMLPNTFPAFPGRTEFDIYASMTPAKEVGGDFYDFFLLDDDHLCMVMADVSGKGVPAALFMMASKITIENHLLLGKSPAEVLTDTNTAICANNKEKMFVTVWVGILQISTGKLVAANAGHEYPVFCMPGGNYELYKDKHGMMVGVMKGIQYQEYEMTLPPGAKLFMYTDGVPEATDANEALFGKERMIEALNGDVTASPEQVLQNIRTAVDGFVKDAEQFDDLTMLCLEYKGKQP